MLAFSLTFFLGVIFLENIIFAFLLGLVISMSLIFLFKKMSCHYDGQIKVFLSEYGTEGMYAHLELDIEPEELLKRNNIILQVIDFTDKRMNEVRR